MTRLAYLTGFVAGLTALTITGRHALKRLLTEPNDTKPQPPDITHGTQRQEVTHGIRTPPTEM